MVNFSDKMPPSWVFIIQVQLYIWLRGKRNGFYIPFIYNYIFIWSMKSIRDKLVFAIVLIAICGVIQCVRVEVSICLFMISKENLPIRITWIWIWLWWLSSKLKCFRDNLQEFNLMNHLWRGNAIWYYYY